MFFVFGPIFYIFREQPFQYGYFAYKLLKPWNEKLAVFVLYCAGIWFGFIIWEAFMLMMLVSVLHMLIFQATVHYLSLMADDLLKCIKIYSTLRIMQKLYNNSYGAQYVPLVKIIFSLLAILGAVLSIRLADGRVALVLCGATFLVFMGCALIVFVSFSAIINQHSLKLKRTLTSQHKGLRKYSRCLLRAYKVVAVSSGGMYDIQKLTCVTVLGFLSNSTATALMSIRI